jgi:selenocysteine lyase/cysteine desulfurase
MEKACNAKWTRVHEYWHATPVGSINPYVVAHDVNSLLPLITGNARIVVITACSNTLGSVGDVKFVVKQVRDPCASFVVEIFDHKR